MKTLADKARYLECMGMNEREIALALGRCITFVRRALARRHPYCVRRVTGSGRERRCS